MYGHVCMMVPHMQPNTGFCLNWQLPKFSLFFFFFFFSNFHEKNFSSSYLLLSIIIIT